jgi:hypothetical protein
MFSTNRNGFTVGFKNGYEVSVAFGIGTYSANKERLSRGRMGTVLSSPTAEICVFVTGTNVAVSNDVLGVDAPAMSSDGVTFGWSTPEVFAAICAKVEALPPVTA